MRIGISVITHAGQNIWENGMGQNVFFLAQSLKAVPFVKSVDLIDVGNQTSMPDQVDLNTFDMHLLKPNQADDKIDVIIELAGALSPQWLALQRARGKKVVYYCVGQPYVALTENSIFDKPSYFPPVGRCDEIWLLPKDQHYIPMMRTLYRCPIYIAPYLWTPIFIRNRIQEAASHALHYGWQPNLMSDGICEPLRIAIFEPNISVVKTASIPMLACNQAYQNNSESIAMMHVLNSLHLKDHLTMLHLANSLKLVQQQKAYFYGRHDIVGFMSQHANAVVSHQWCNDQNYMYMDVLYGDYPLIHNAEWLKSFDVGYYYPDFDAMEAGRQIHNAWQHHNINLSAQQQKNHILFKTTDPLSTANIQIHTQLLTHLCADQPELLKG